ncbi:hypothetical protein C7B77_14855 [Chamaesiphon polymorphus CCALA 037]|uniref:YbjN domain-containing protein n=2 Tax=Chamaesiphon TaxID=217161 RepID=A0A2T1GDD9_9CYAN|nr:hypothetical protein C7B77_14855 [Chamaesiphon polymorphus CCALA 037]
MNRAFSLKNLSLVVATLSILLGSFYPSARAGETDARVKAALEQAGMKYEVTSDGDFKVIVTCPNDRTQVVLINSNTNKINGTTVELREVYALAYKSPGLLSSEISDKMMRQSHDKKIGSWEIIRTSSNNNLAIFNAKIDAKLDDNSLVKIINSIGLVADNMEKELTNKDEY